MKTRNKTDKRSEAGKAEELHVMQLAAISTAAFQNTPSSINNRILPENPYYTTVYADVCRAIDREIMWRSKCLVANALVTKFAVTTSSMPHVGDEKTSSYEKLSRVLIAQLQKILEPEQP